MCGKLLAVGGGFHNFTVDAMPAHAVTRMRIRSDDQIGAALDGPVNHDAGFTRLGVTNSLLVHGKSFWIVSESWFLDAYPRSDVREPF